MVEQSRAQNLRPSASARHRSREAAEHSLSLWQGVQRRVELGTHTSLTTPGSMAPVTPRQPQPIGQLPAVQTREHTPPAPVKMQMLDAQSDLSLHGSPNPPRAPSGAASTLGPVSGAGASGVDLASGVGPPPSGLPAETSGPAHAHMHKHVAATSKLPHCFITAALPGGLNLTILREPRCAR